MHHLSRPLAAFLILFGFLPQLGSQTIPLRVMAANLNGNVQSYQPFALRIFEGLKPDIVAIQEFNYGNNTPADFRAMLDTAFGTNFVYYRESGFNIPNGIISRYPIITNNSWTDPLVNDRSFAWAKIDLPGTNDLYIVSVHLYSSGTESDRNTEATTLKSHIQSEFPPGAWVIVAGDFNTSSRSEACVTTFKTFLSDSPVPTDATSGGNPNTNEPRSKPYDYVLPSFGLTNFLTSSSFASHSFPNGLVFDSRVYTPLSDIAPVLVTDSSNAQHMAVIKDFLIPAVATSGPPVITGQPQSQTVGFGSNATFSVTASGTVPLSFQWLFNGTNINGATASSYTRTNAQSADAGTYSVLVTNSAGTMASSNATLTVTLLPIIVAQPQSLTVSPGQDATFAVSVTGLPPLSYQWRFMPSDALAPTNIFGATSSTYTRSNAQSAHAGKYSVLVTNSAGSVTSAAATLTVAAVSSSVVAQWDFNSPTPDVTVGTGTTSPSTGTGSASLVGGTTQAFFSGSNTDPASSGSDNSGWSATSFPAATVGNKTAGVQFNVSTAGRQNITIRWDQRASATGSKYLRMQYSTNGTLFIDYPTPNSFSAATVFETETNSLVTIPGVNDNPNFAFRIVAEFEGSAINNGNNSYVGAGGTYGTGGTIRLDMVTVFGSVIPPNNPPPTPATLSASLLDAQGQFQLNLTGAAGSNYIIQAATNLGSSNWLSLTTNTSPFTFIDTNVLSFPLRFYRAIGQ